MNFQLFKNYLDSFTHRLLSYMTLIHAKTERYNKLVTLKLLHIQSLLFHVTNVLRLSHQCVLTFKINLCAK